MTTKKKLQELENRITALEQNTLVKYKCLIASKNKEIKMLKERVAELTTTDTKSE